MADPHLVTRQECGLRLANPARLQPREGQLLWGITTHITVTPSNTPLATWRQIQADYMTGHNGNHEIYGDLPYNVGIAMDGRILEGRDDVWVGAHAKSRNNLLNRQTLGVAFICQPGQLTAAAKVAYKTVVLVNALKYHRAMILLCHSDAPAFGGPATGCPDDPIRPFVRQVAADAAHGH